MKRGKKPATNQSSTPGQTPLQPAYYDLPEALPDDIGNRVDPRVAPVPEGKAAQAAPASIAEAAPDATPDDAAVAAPSAAVPADRNRRRRRGRGGRERGRRGTAAVAQQPAEGVAKEVVPATGEDGAAMAATAASASAAPRVSKGLVVLTVGLPGSGKSSWFKRHDIRPLSSDLLRDLLFDDPTEQRFQDLVFSNLRSMLKARLIARRPMNYVDATNLSPHDRHSWIKLAKDNGYEVHALYFDVPVEVCLERNQKRQRVVPEDVMRRMAGKLKPPTFEEGFSKITVVRVKQKPAEVEPTE